MDRRAAPLPRRHRAGRVRGGDRDPAGPAGRASTEDEWATVGFTPVGERPYAVFMEVRVFDSWVHEQDVRLALDRPGGSGNQASALSIDRMQGAMGYVVGKRARCPEGTAVRFVVTGPERDARDFTVAVVDGRAAEVDDVAPRSPCRSRASTSSGSAAAGSAPPRWRPPDRSASRGTRRPGRPCSPP